MLIINIVNLLKENNSIKEIYHFKTQFSPVKEEDEDLKINQINYHKSEILWKIWKKINKEDKTQEDELILYNINNSLFLKRIIFFWIKKEKKQMKIIT